MRASFGLIVAGALVVAVAQASLQASVPEPEASETLTSKHRCRMRLFAGPATRQKPFWVTAYVQNGDEQNCTLKLPAGVRFDKDERASKPVQTPADKHYAILAWRVISEQTGDYTLEAVLTNGLTEKATAKVLEPGSFR
jgi:hypothetical protein